MPEPYEKRTLRIAICDDNPLMLEHLRDLVQQALSSQWQISIICDTSPRKLLSNKLGFQIAVLDIQLLESNGIDIARTMITQSPNCRIIFVSGFPRYVSDVYDVPHVCLVLKEQLDEQLPKFLLRAAMEVTSQEDQLISIRVKGAYQQLRVADICFLERKGHTTFIHMRSGPSIQTRSKLDELLFYIANWHMCRCHVSYAVNLQYVEALQERDFVLQGGRSIPISRVNMPAAKSAFFRYLRETV